LEKAVARGAKRGAGRAEAENQRALTEEELKRLHSDQRLQLSEHIEACVSKLTNHFPGFRYETVMDERGWGPLSRATTSPAAARPAGRTCTAGWR
jgi:hypothetical protein